LADLGEGEWLGQVVEDLHLKCRAHVFQRRIAGHDDDAQVRPPQEQLLKDLVAFELTHFHVKQHNVREVLLAAQEEVFRMGESADGVQPLVFEKVFNIVAEVKIVIEDGDLDQGGRAGVFHRGF
jgi:hypothetical protein